MAAESSFPTYFEIIVCLAIFVSGPDGLRPAKIEWNGGKDEALAKCWPWDSSR